MYQDLGDLEEDERIKKIGDACLTGNVVAFVTDDDPGKAERYIEKLKKRFPSVKVTDRFAGPVAGTVTVKVSVPKG